MTDENKDNPKPTGEDNTETTDAPVETVPAPKNIVEQAEEANTKLTATLEELKKVTAELATLKANEALSGTTGGNVKVEPKEETPLEYRDRIDKEISEGKHGD